MHPESELRNAKADYRSKGGLVHMFVNHIEVDEDHLIVTGQNQKSGVEVAEQALVLLAKKIK